MKAPFPLLGALTALLAVPSAAASQSPRQALVPPLAESPNILLIVLDDVGLDYLGAYGEAPGVPPCTPVIDALAAGGLLFRNAWTNPMCSPTRAQILTGRHGFRTGIGLAINGLDPAAFFGLQGPETTAAEVLAGRGYSTALFGKWHLATANHDSADPLLHGFQWFEGVIAGTVGHIERPGATMSGCPVCPPGCQLGMLGYERWVKSTNGVESCDTRYATTANVDDALATLGTSLPEPWFADVSFNAIHHPFEEPPAALCPGSAGCACAGALVTDTEKARAMLEAADTEIGRLVASLRSRSARPTYVFLIADNGTPGPVAGGTAGGCFDPLRSKSTLYEAGVNVPLIVNGPGIRPGEAEALVSSTDLFATFAELAGAGASAEDSVSLVPYLRGFRGSLRDTVYAEGFRPNGLPFAPTEHQRAIRDQRYKLIRRTGQADELYDLASDPCETIDLFPPAPGSAAAAAWQELNEKLKAMGVG